jgi:UPF0755 protein
MKTDVKINNILNRNPINSRSINGRPEINVRSGLKHNAVFERFRFIKFIILPSLILLILILSVSCKLFRVEDEEAEVIPDAEVEIEIKEGMTLKQIATLLEENGVIDNAFLFRLFVEQKGMEGSLMPGNYRMKTNSSYEDVLDEITSGPPVVTYKFTIPEGFTVNQVIERVAEKIPFIEYEELEKAIDIGSYNYEFLEGALTLEGFLFPKTYEITIDYTAKDIIEMMLAQYQFETGSLDYSFAGEKGLSRYDILKIASLIEREAYVPEERVLISAVIHNRLDAGMPLGIDATLRYFLNKWDSELTESDLETDTEYNTRLYTGLPPTPICNPGLASIEAALNPADEDYLYFVVTDTEKHTHKFSTTLEDHEKNRSEAK